jgi:tRNA modification GTPase
MSLSNGQDFWSRIFTSPQRHKGHKVSQRPSVVFCELCDSVVKLRASAPSKLIAHSSRLAAFNYFCPMNSPLSGWDDTIVALATPPGIGAIGVIRVSGPQAFEVVNQLFPSKDLNTQASHTLHVGYLKDGDTTLDEVVLSIFKAPKSYTGEDVIEISSHGSPFVQENIIRAITGRGVRMAKPGEFTQRAFLHGKMDLTQAEAVADLIASNTEASRRTALHSMRGGFSSDLQQLREQLIRFSALIELELDFSQEDVEFADRTQLQQLITQLAGSTQQLLSSSSSVMPSAMACRWLSSANPMRVSLRC